MGQLQAARRLGAAAVEHAGSGLVGRDAPHHLGALAGQRRVGHHVDVAGLPHPEGPASLQRFDDRGDEVAEAAVLNPGRRVPQPVHPADRRHPGHRGPLRAQQQCLLAGHLEHPVEVHRVGRRVLVGPGLGAVEHPVRRHQYQLGLGPVSGPGQALGRSYEAAPGQVPVGVHGREVVEDHRVDDHVGIEVVHAGLNGPVVEKVEALDGEAARVGGNEPVDRAVHSGSVALGEHLHDVRPDEAGPAGHIGPHAR